MNKGCCLSKMWFAQRGNTWVMKGLEEHVKCREVYHKI